MKRTMLSVVFCVLALPAFCHAGAAGGAYVIDDGRSSIRFEARSTLHPVKGAARAYSGAFDVNEGAGVKGEVTVDVAQVLTGNKGLDRTMHRMFESVDFPAITCRVGSLERTAPGAGRLSGAVRIRAVERPFESVAAVEETDDAIRLKGEVTLSLKAYDLRPPTVMGVIRMADTVLVVYDVVLVKQG